MGQPIIRHLPAAFAAIFLLLAGLLQPAAAAQNAPLGSYLLSCRNVQVQSLLGGSGTNLVASCRTNDGRYVQSMLPNNCSGDISNVNGQLTCSAGGGPNNTPPSGSYQLNRQGVRSDCAAAVYEIDLFPAHASAHVSWRVTAPYWGSRLATAAWGRWQLAWQPSHPDRRLARCGAIALPNPVRHAWRAGVWSLASVLE